MVEVVEVDPRDEAALRTFWATEQVAIRHDCPDAIIRTWDGSRSPSSPTTAVGVSAARVRRRPRTGLRGGHVG